MARTETSLLERLQGVIERTYDLSTGVRDIGRFVIGDEGYRRIYADLEARGDVVQKVAGSAVTGARTLLRQTHDGALSVSVYYPDELIGCLERNDPTRRLDDANVDAFAALVEELDHLLVIADRYRANGELSLLELELHAEVTKYLVLALFVARMRRSRNLPATDLAWIRWHLFHKRTYADPDPAVRDRYRDASRLASRYVSRLDTMHPADRPRELRLFHRMSPQQKIAHIVAG